MSLSVYPLCCILWREPKGLAKIERYLMRDHSSTRLDVKIYDPFRVTMCVSLFVSLGSNTII